MNTNVADTVFVSSTFEDLKLHRRAVWTVLEQFDVNVRGMEEFGARPDTPLDTCLTEVEQSDVYVGIVAYRLGSIDDASQKSFTQLEYEHARQLGRQILIYVIDEANARVAIRDIDMDPSLHEKLDSFKRTLKQNHTIGSFTSPEDLSEKLKRDFGKLLRAKNTVADVLIAEEEFAVAADVLKSFWLLPKLTSGREVRLRFAPKGEPYPASLDICESFNLPYGSTLGLSIAIEAPEGEHVGDFTELYAAGERAEDLLARIGRPPCDVYVRLQFSPTPVTRKRAEFFERTYHTYPTRQAAILPMMQDPTIASSLGDVKTHHVPAEGKVILLYANVAA